MTKHRTPVNAASFVDALTEPYYSRHKKLKHEREKLARWLRKKCKSSQQAQLLADKLEQCRRKHRCKLGACPDCADAARRLFIKTLRRYLKTNPNVACVTIVPADGITKRGTLS